MIHMPHRSVTRYFIPMIDVLLLLFCIFLLMPIGGESKLQEEQDKNGELSSNLEIARSDLQRKSDENARYEENLPKLEEMQKYKDEVEKYKDKVDQLRRLGRKSLQEKTIAHVIDIDGKTADISWYDASQPEDKARMLIADESAARKLIERHRLEAGDKHEVYYYFLYPRPKPEDFPTNAQRKKLARYKVWFDKTANSLKDTVP